MRKVPIEYVKDGHYTARPIYSDKGMLLVAEGYKLTASAIDKIALSGHTSIYIVDEYSQQEMEDVLKPKVRSKLLDINNKMSKLVVQSESYKIDKKVVGKYIDNLSDIVDNILNDIMNSTDIMNNLGSISIHDDNTFQHSLNVMFIAVVLGKYKELNMSCIKELALGTILHDIGKIFIPKEILTKPGKLTPEEFDIIKTHPLKGFEFLRDYTDLNARIRIMALEHHERCDGSGYPFNKNNDSIYHLSRICAISDVVEALTADRPYRKGVPLHEVREYIMASSGTLFDKDTVDVCIGAINPYPIDTRVRLSNGSEGTVSGINNRYYTRPKIKIYCENGKKSDGYEVDLLEVKNVVINEIIYEFAFEKQIVQ